MPSKVIGAISGGSKKSSATKKGSFERSPFITDTGVSTISGRSIRLDPSIRRIQDEALNKYAGIYGDIGQATDRFLHQSGGLRGRTRSDFGGLREGFGGLREDVGRLSAGVGGLRGELSGIGTDLSDVRSRYLGNQGRLVEARLRPVRERFADLTANVQQGLGRRGLGGSSFLAGTLRDVERERALTEGDVRAQAAAEALGFERDILGQQAGLVGQRAGLFGQQAGMAGQQGQFLGAEADIASNLANFESQLNAQELDSLNNAAQQQAQITGETLEVAKARLLQELGIFGLGERGKTTGTVSGREKGFGVGVGVGVGVGDLMQAL